MVSPQSRHGKQLISPKSRGLRDAERGKRKRWKHRMIVFAVHFAAAALIVSPPVSASAPPTSHCSVDGKGVAISGRSEAAKKAACLKLVDAAWDATKSYVLEPAGPVTSGAANHVGAGSGR